MHTCTTTYIEVYSTWLESDHKQRIASPFIVKSYVCVLIWITDST
jgi:hypothetical protein